MESNNNFMDHFLSPDDYVRSKIRATRGAQ